jgi:DNA-binding NtrC family response regulator
MVLCDLNLPGGSGLELRRRVMRHAPALGERFVLMTGETIGNVQLGADDGDVQLLEKPFTLDELMAVQERMAGAPAQ